MELEQLRQYRDALLMLIYQQGAGKMWWAISRDEAETALGISHSEFRAVETVLRQQGCLGSGHPLSLIGLSQKGQLEAERLDQTAALRPLPAMPTPMVNNGIINHGNQVIGGSHDIVQQGGAGSTMNASGSWTPTELLAAISRIEASIPQLGLQDDVITELREQLDDLRKKAQAPAPKRGIIAAIGQEAAKILTGGATGAATSLGKLLIDSLPRL